MMKTPILCHLLLLPAAFALTVPRRMASRRVVHSQSSLPSPSALFVGGQGWDNDNFLNSLGGDEDDLNRANDDYYSMSKYGRPEDNEPDIPLPNIPADPDSLPTQDISGAALTEEMKQKAKNSHTPEEEASQGGQMFRKLLERAQQQPSRNIPPPMYTPPPPPPPQPQPMQQPVQQRIQPPADFNTLSVEEQARLFREMMAQQQQPQLPQQTQQPNPYAPNPYAPPPGGAYPPPPGQPPKGSYLGPGIAPDGRKIGRNKDADAIVNTADLYFAQLKRDSTTRNYARYAGDDNKANAVFHDPSIEQIKMHVNPYLIEQAEKEKEMYTTVPEEMIIFHDYNEEPKQPKNYAGISYKEKLAQLKARKQGLPVPPTQREIQAKLAAKEESRRILEVGETPPAIPAVPEPYRGLESVPQQQQQEEENVELIPPQIMDADASQEIVDQTFQAPVQQIQEQPRPTLNSDDVMTGDTRADIRTLMGLILKHRGGPGFGAGRLQGEEAARLEALAQAIPHVLRQEEPQTKTSVPPFSSSVSGPVNLDSMIACIEGAVTMYRNSPSELQGSVLVTLRAALLSALDTLAQEIQNTTPLVSASAHSMTEMPTSSFSLTPEQAEKIFSMNACIEGAITMYKNSPAQLRSSVLVTLNAALMSAVSTCNEIIASAGEVGPAVNSKAVPDAPKYSGNDPNSLMLQEIYEKIKEAGGDGPMGLRADMSAEEAQELQDSLTDMRTLLVDELHSGIPEDSNEALVEPQASDAVSDNDTPTSSSTASTYRKMLQRARDEKEASDGFQ